MNNKSFSLIEIIVATILLALTLVSLTNLFVVGKRYILHSRSRMSGGELGKYFLDPLQNYVRQEDWIDTDNDYDSNNRLRINPSPRTDPTPTTINAIPYTPTYTVSIPPGSPDNQMRSVTVQINWPKSQQ